MLNSYRRIFEIPGTLRFSFVGLIPRGASAMYALAIVIFISQYTNSYALAGMVSAAFVISQAVCSPQIARLVDRLGQRKIMLPVSLSCVSFSTLLLILVITKQHPIFYILCSAAAGATIGSYNALVRARWVKALNSPADIHTAFSWEATFEESTYIVGPVLSTFLATAIVSWAGLAVAISLLLIGSILFLSDRSTEPHAHPKPAHQVTRSALYSRAMVMLVGLFFTLGCIFGASDVSTIAFAQALHMPSNAGLPLGVYALGSALSGFIYGAVPQKGLLRLHFMLGAVGIGLVSANFYFMPNLWGLSLIMFLSGLFIGPTYINGNSLVRKHVAPYKITEGLAWLSTGINLGLAGGSTLAGSAIDAWGYQGGFIVVSVASISAICLAFLTWPVLKRPVRKLSLPVKKNQ